MNVASLELCKELYELSDWQDCPFWHSELTRDGRYEYDLAENESGHQIEYLPSAPNGKNSLKEYVPAYDLGYLWRKADEMTGNEFAVGYNDSGACYHFTWGNRGADFMTEGIGERFTAEPAEIEDSFAQWLIYLLQSA